MNVRVSILLVSVVVTACAPRVHPPRATKSVPSSFSVGSALTNAAGINWRDYFTDQNLIALIDTTLTRNYDMLSALQKIEAAKAGVVFSKGALLPYVSAAGVPAVRRYGLYTMDGAGNATTDILPGQVVPVNLPDYLVGFQSLWEVDVVGKLRNRKKAATARYLSTEQGKNWLTTNLVAEVAMSYYELQSLDLELEMIRENLAIQQNALSVVAIQKETGLANELAVKQFQAQLLNTRAMETEVLQKIVDVESRINFLCGRYPQSVSRSKIELIENAERTIGVGVPADLLQNRPDIRQAELELMAARADVLAARAAFFPGLVIGSSVGYQAFKPSLLFTTPESFAFTLVGGLSAPLLNRSAIKAQFKSASVVEIEALYNYQKVILNAVTEVFRETSNLSNLQLIQLTRGEEVNVLVRAIDTSNELFRTGRATYLEVLLTQQNAMNARMDFIDVRKRQMFATVNLYRALGGGWK
ncbi:MAG: TolC family protein [Bacteroidota bacterium]